MTEERLTGDRHCIRCGGFLPRGSLIDSADGTRVLEFSGGKGDPKAGWFHSKPTCSQLERATPAPAPAKLPTLKNPPTAAPSPEKTQGPAPARPEPPQTRSDPAGASGKPHYIEIAGWVRAEYAAEILAGFEKGWARETE